MSRAKWVFDELQFDESPSSREKLIGNAHGQVFSTHSCRSLGFCRFYPHRHQVKNLSLAVSFVVPINLKDGQAGMLEAHGSEAGGAIALALCP